MARRITNEVLAQKLDDLTKIVSEHVKQDDERFQRIFFDNGKPSVFSRLNSLEEVEGKRTWHIRSIWTAMLAAIATVVVTYLAKGS